MNFFCGPSSLERGGDHFTFLLSFERVACLCKMGLIATFSVMLRFTSVGGNFLMNQVNEPRSRTSQDFCLELAKRDKVNFFSLSFVKKISPS